MIKLAQTLLLVLLCATSSFAQTETFTAKRVVNQAPTSAVNRYFLEHPYEIAIGPDDSLWISEKSGRVLKVSTITGRADTLLNHRSNVWFTRTFTAGAVTGVAQDGMLGMVLHPNLNLGTGQDSVYIIYCYNNAGARRMRISAFKYNRAARTLTNETILLQNIPASNDHNSGRMAIGPDMKLYVTIGDLGANQFGNKCNAIRSQDVPTNAEVTANDYTKYQGKILRLNMNGSIPSDNPLFSSVRSHIFSIGHRNPQGLVFERNSSGNTFSGSRLYSNEHGPAADDEINIIQSGKNYGWPNVSGYKDNYWYRYYNWSSAGNCSSQSYGSECSVPTGVTAVSEFSFTDPNFVAPVFTMSTKDSNGYTMPCSWLQNPTVAPASMSFYHYSDKIPGWQNSLLIPTLKKGTLYRVKLNATGNGIQGDTIPFFREENRYRDIAIAKDGITFYMITDSVGNTSGPTTGNTNTLFNRGSILEYKYTGPLLSVGSDPINPRNARLYISVYPNPVNNILTVEMKRNISKPLRYELLDMMGRTIQTGTSPRDMFPIYMTGMVKGMYILKMYNGSDVLIATEKIIKQ